MKAHVFTVFVWSVWMSAACTPAPLAAVGSVCQQNADCLTNDCEDGGCVCVAPGSACTSDPDCCAGYECREFVCVAEQVSCVPSGATLSSADAAASDAVATDASTITGPNVCCSGVSSQLGGQSVCCNPSGAACTTDLQCCGAMCVMPVANPSAGSGFCCSPLGAACIPNAFECCGNNLECGQDTCCLRPQTTCVNNSDCCNGTCDPKNGCN
jgi:hypothetical protein